MTTMDLRTIVAVGAATLLAAALPLSGVVQARESAARDAPARTDCVGPDAGRAYGALMVGAWTGDAALVKAVVTKCPGLSVDVIPEHWSDTPLNRAAARGHSEVLRILLEAGASPNRAGASGWFPLTSAVHSGSADSVALLLASGAEVESSNGPNQFTALERAARYGQTRIARMLVQAGARPRRANAPAGADAIVLARRHGHEELAKFLEAVPSRP